jgi:hypothetical protein
VCVLRGRPKDNRNLEAFFNASVDAALVLQTFMIAATEVGLGTCPISVIRNRLDDVVRILALPPGVVPVAGADGRLPGFGGSHQHALAGGRHAGGRHLQRRWASRPRSRVRSEARGAASDAGEQAARRREVRDIRAIWLVRGQSPASQRKRGVRFRPDGPSPGIHPGLRTPVGPGVHGRMGSEKINPHRRRHRGLGFLSRQAETCVGIGPGARRAWLHPLRRILRSDLLRNSRSGTPGGVPSP